MKTKMKLAYLLVLGLIPGTAPAQEKTRETLPPGYWTLSQSEPILAKTLTVRLAPDLSSLTDGEKKAVEALLEAGEIFQKLYEQERHAEARSSLEKLRALDKKLGSPKVTRNLLDLYRMHHGPIATTLDNERTAFLPAGGQPLGKNVYPLDVTKEEIDSFLTEEPELRSEILHPRTVVRRATAANLARDQATLAKYPALAVLHGELSEQLTELAKKPSGKKFYAVPYPVAWPAEMSKAFELLNRAARAAEKDDPEFAGYLRNRARDLLTNDYESGDASWVTGKFKKLNAQIGPYETYDDGLYGVKSFFSLSLLLRNEEKSAELRGALKGLQQLEDSLPYGHHKRIREDLPVGVYEVIADFGQARGTNTASILPNDALTASRYGRTILLRENIMRHPDLFASNLPAWKAAVTPSFEDDLKPEGDFYRTLWHEIGHYMGVAVDRQGRDLDSALQEHAAALEEMKADLVSMFLARELRKRNYYDEARLRAVYTAGIRRTLQNIKPNRDQPYQTMQLMQFNYFLDRGLLEFDRLDGGLIIHYEKLHDTVAALLREVLEVQYQGDREAAGRFIEKWTTWKEELHGVIAGNMREAQKYRFRIVRYGALGE